MNAMQLALLQAGKVTVGRIDAFNDRQRREKIEAMRQKAWVLIKPHLESERAVDSAIKSEL